MQRERCLRTPSVLAHVVARNRRDQARFYSAPSLENTYHTYPQPFFCAFSHLSGQVE